MKQYTSITIEKRLAADIEDIRAKKGLRSNPALLEEWTKKEQEKLEIDLLEYQPEKPYLVEIMKDALQLCGKKPTTRNALQLALIVEKWEDE